MSTRSRFEKLLEPYRIGSVQTRNRMIKVGAGTCYWHQDELHMNSTTKAFYEAIARGGVGLLIVESPTLDFPLGTHMRRRFRIDDDKYIQGLSELTEVIHKYSCPTFVQLYHTGPWQRAPFLPGLPIAASAVTINSELDSHNETPHELTIGEIEELVDKFASAAVRAQKAGFDGVEVNAGSSHLLSTFLSRFWNKRQDVYGCGGLENRSRFVIEIITEIKKRLGRDFPVSVLINGIEVGKGIGVGEGECMTVVESQGIAHILQEGGADAIHIRSHWFGNHAAFIPDALFYPEPFIPLKDFPSCFDWKHKGAGATVPLAAAIKKSVSIPVVAVGRLDPVLGEKALREGKADFIGLNRRLFADPELPNKIASGKFDDIVPCTGCCACMTVDNPSHCRVNAAMGTDQYIIEPAEKRKKVFIAGGGPAGMEAARVAALRGHEVTLFEKESQLGGLLPVAAIVKDRDIEDLTILIRYLKEQITKLGVNIRLKQELTASDIDKAKPDVVIVANGGISILPNIPGINSGKVISSSSLAGTLKKYLKYMGPETITRLTRLWMPVGKKVVIIGGAIQACQLAEFLTKRGRKVTIVEMGEKLGEGMVEHARTSLFMWFKKKGVVALTLAKYEGITDQGLIITTREGNRQTIQADTIIPALPLGTNSGLLKNIEGKVPEIYVIGDSREPGLIKDAIADGWRVAHEM
jgi:2,4-dienoyl-CoA reductase (NADPH2)